MSSKPYPEGVSKVLAALVRADKVEARIRELKPLVLELQMAQAELGELSDTVDKLLNEMDLEAQGNFGFGGRMGWFVVEMRRQILATTTKET